MQRSLSSTQPTQVSSQRFPHHASVGESLEPFALTQVHGVVLPYKGQRGMTTASAMVRFDSLLGRLEASGGDRATEFVLAQLFSRSELAFLLERLGEKVGSEERKPRLVEMLFRLLRAGRIPLRSIAVDAKVRVVEDTLPEEAGIHVQSTGMSLARAVRRKPVRMETNDLRLSVAIRQTFVAMGVGIVKCGGVVAQGVPAPFPIACPGHSVSLSSIGFENLRQQHEIFGDCNKDRGDEGEIGEKRRRSKKLVSLPDEEGSGEEEKRVVKKRKKKRVHHRPSLPRSPPPSTSPKSPTPPSSPSVRLELSSSASPATCSAPNPSPSQAPPTLLSRFGSLQTTGTTQPTSLPQTTSSIPKKTSPTTPIVPTLAPKTPPSPDLAAPSPPLSGESTQPAIDERDFHSTAAVAQDHLQLLQGILEETLPQE